MYPAVRDIKAALRWVHANAHKYHADTSSITLQGGSAGATAVIELAVKVVDSEPRLRETLVHEAAHAAAFAHGFGSTCACRGVPS